PRDYDPALVGTQLATLWPSLNDEILNKKPKSKHPTRTLQPPIEKLPPPELKADGSLRFPWAARLSPQSRNLYRAATPTYRLDGTPEVSIPSKVLKLGPENKDEYIIGNEIPVVDIDLILQQKDCSTSTPEVFESTTSKLDGQGVTVPVPALPSVEDVHDLPSGTSVILDGTGNQILGTSFTSSHFQQEKPADLSNSVPTLPRLIMESFPSSNINTEVLGSFVVGPLTTTPNHCVFQSPSGSTVIRDGDEVEIEPSSSFSLTRGGRESKPPIKYENMEWKTVRGRGKHGRRGRGSYH
ncbi:unnamed protein product, partial [Brassica napus]